MFTLLDFLQAERWRFEKRSAMPSADTHLEHRAIRSLTEVSHMDPDGFFCVILDFVVNLFF